MISRRLFASSFALCVALALSGGAQAAEKQPFTQAAFDAARAADKPVLVEVTAPWCPTCKAQKPILSDLLSQPKFHDLQVFEVDFDSQKDALRNLKVQMQSTLICFKGSEEAGRSTGDTKRQSLAALLDKTL